MSILQGSKLMLKSMWHLKRSQRVNTVLKKKNKDKEDFQTPNHRMMLIRVVCYRNRDSGVDQLSGLESLANMAELVLRSMSSVGVWETVNLLPI